MRTQALALCLTFALGAAGVADTKAQPAGKTEQKTERKTVTLINAEGKADGGSEISRESVRECIVSLPSVDALEPEVISESRYLREINGDPTKNAWTKIHTARIIVNYMVYKKDMLIVTTRSIEGRDPTMKEVEKRLPRTQEFASNPADGDTYAGRSNRQYYYTTAEGAAKDARARAQVWLKQQAPLLCGDVR